MEKFNTDYKQRITKKKEVGETFRMMWFLEPCVDRLVVHLCSLLVFRLLVWRHEQLLLSSIKTANTDGTDVKTLPDSVCALGSSLTFDYSQNRLFWVNSFTQ